MLLDDVGFGAASTFGGPAHTPTLDKLAAQGLRYNRFHLPAICSPTRAALLSGRNDHAIGFGSIEEAASDHPGYDMIWPESAASVAEVLRLNGYATAAFGKWHNTPHEERSPVGPFDRWPTGLGFDYFYGFMGGWEDHWEPSRLYRDTTPVEAPKTPAQGYYLTSDLVDDAISWVKTQRTLAPQKPYFLYFAAGATHWPHQVPREWIEKYRGRFDQGWHKLREEVFARQKALGVIPQDADLTAWPAEMSRWDALTDDQKKVSSRQMEVYAAFLEFTDREIGRLIDAAQAGPGGGNTLVLYVVGDNGAQEGPNENQMPDSAIQYELSHLDDIGAVGYPGRIAGGWALAADTPFQWTKFFASHLGGTRDPLVVSWPAGIKQGGGLRSQYTHVVDVAPTLYELAHISPPRTVHGVRQQPLDGVSFAYSFDDPDAPSRHRVQVFEQGGNRSIYQDGWLASARHLHLDPITGMVGGSSDFVHDRWELYDLETDYSQAHDVAEQYPQKLEALQALFDKEARRNQIYPLQSLVIPPLLPQRADEAGDYVFYPGLPRIQATTAPHFYAVPFYSITVDVETANDKSDGILASYGSRYGGFVLYAKDGDLIYESNYFQGHTRVVGDSPLVAGKSEVVSEFVRDMSAPGNQYGLATGTVRLYINGKKVAEQSGVRQAFNFPAVDSGTFGIGRGYGSPVSDAYRLPARFNGEIARVDVRLGEPPSP